MGMGAEESAGGAVMIGALAIEAGIVFPL